MFGGRTLTVQDYLAFLRRRWWMVLIPAIVGGIAGYGVSRVLPKRFTSRALILVQQQQVPDRLVVSLVNEQLTQRLASMQQQILSRSRLQPLIERFNLFPQDRANTPMETLVDRMRKDVQVTPLPPSFGGTGDTLPGFSIEFTGTEPQTVQAVCSEITSMFITESLKFREKRAQDTTDFLTQQLGEAKRNLDAQDALLADFKSKNMSRLPGTEQTNLAMLGSLAAQLDSTNQALTRAEQEKTYMETLLAQQLASQQATEAGASPEVVEQQLSRAQAELSALEARYTPQHPDVRKKRNEVEQLRAKASQAPERPASKPEVKRLDSPEVQQLRSRIFEREQLLREKAEQQRKLQQQIASYESRVQGSPVVEEQFKHLTRDYETALAFYNDLLKKRTESEMSTDLERRQQGEQFRLMDAPNRPERPDFPDPLKFAGGGLAGGLALGVGLSLLLEFRKQPIYTEADIDFYLQLPMLGVLPEVSFEPGNNGVLNGAPAKTGRKSPFQKVRG